MTTFFNSPLFSHLTVILATTSMIGAAILILILTLFWPAKKESDLTKGRIGLTIVVGALSCLITMIFCGSFYITEFKSHSLGPIVFIFIIALGVGGFITYELYKTQLLPIETQKKITELEKKISEDKGEGVD